MRINKPNKRILILCEGLTEYFYAKSLQAELPRSFQRSLSISIVCNSKNDPKSIAAEARKRKIRARKERNSYDSIWLFFDNDNSSQLDAAFRIINNEGFCVAYSSICIEHWFILHIENCGRAFRNGSEALNHLKKLWPGYHKTKMKHYQELRSKLELAIDRAKTLRKNVQTDLPRHQRNPFFTIDRLIKFFNDFEE